MTTPNNLTRKLPAIALFIGMLAGGCAGQAPNRPVATASGSVIPSKESISTGRLSETACKALTHIGLELGSKGDAPIVIFEVNGGLGGSLPETAEDTKTLRNEITVGDSIPITQANITAVAAVETTDEAQKSFETFVDAALPSGVSINDGLTATSPAKQDASGVTAMADQARTAVSDAYGIGCV